MKKQKKIFEGDYRKLPLDVAWIDEFILRASAKPTIMSKGEVPHSEGNLYSTEDAIAALGLSHGTIENARIRRQRW